MPASIKREKARRIELTAKRQSRTIENEHDAGWDKNPRHPPAQIPLPRAARHSPAKIAGNARSPSSVTTGAHNPVAVANRAQVTSVANAMEPGKIPAAS